MSIVKTIFEQLGGNRFVIMTGSKNFVAVNEYTLRCKLSKNKCNAQYMLITLNSKDLYDMKFIRINSKTLDNKVIQEFNDVYCDQLQSTFTQATGLYTTLK